MSEYSIDVKTIEGIVTEVKVEKQALVFLKYKGSHTPNYMKLVMDTSTGHAAPEKGKTYSVVCRIVKRNGYPTLAFLESFNEIQIQGPIISKAMDAYLHQKKEKLSSAAEFIQKTLTDLNKAPSVFLTM